MKNKVLVSPSSFGDCGNESIELLHNNFEVIMNPYKRKLNEEEVIALGKECIGIVAGVEPLTKKVMDELPMLKCISRVGVGMDNVDLDYAKQKGIIVKNTPYGPTRAVAELTIGLTFDILRRISSADRKIRDGKWQKEFGNLLFNKKIGIIGLGKIGKLVAEIFRGLGNPVIGYDTYVDEIWAKNNQVKITDKDTLIAESDIITLHVSQKECIIAARELSLMKKSAYLINMSRGGVVDEESLYNVLENKQISGAALDVYNNEPYSGKFINLDNVVLTPHMGSYAIEGRIKMELDSVINLLESL